MSEYKCPCCGTVNPIVIGQTWINSSGYKVKILDIGDNDIWVLYLENENRVPWDKRKFREQYVLLENPND